MAGRVEGKVAFITGAARGQGRSHAIRLAQEGADIIAVDIVRAGRHGAAYPMATEEDLAETVKAGRGARPADRRAQGGRPGLRGAARRPLDDGVAQLGKLDIVCATPASQTQPVLDWTTRPGRT